MAWSKDLPADTEKIRDLGRVIRANWDAIVENDTTVFNDSLNQWVIHLIDRAHASVTGPDTPVRIDDIGMLYCRKDGTNNELFFQDSQDPANEVQLTLSDELTVGSEGSTFLPGGIILKWGTKVIPGSSGSHDVDFPTAFPNNCFSVVATLIDSANHTKVQGYINQTAAVDKFIWENAQGVAASIYWQAIGN